jgi:hypothetical protein
MSRYIFAQLDSAEQTLRESLHCNDLDPTACDHMERAMSRVREAYIAINEIGKARSVRRLLTDLEGANRLAANVRRRDQLAGTTKTICV